ncbi:MAG: DUF748 domain-containing protein [Candidatus Omnitrophica bacterium]|nr:DUF748 domain-containing protein [Candidatus Omnitrophota bacterium]
MKKLLIVLIWIIAVILVLLLTAGLLIHLYGKKIVVGQVKENLGIEASLDSIGLKLPLTVELKNLKLGELASVERISLAPNLLGFLAGKIVIADLLLENPQVHLVKSTDGAINLPKLKQGGKSAEVFITGLKIRNGKFTYNDKFIVPEGLQTVLNNINCSISKVMLPITSLKANLDFNATLEGPAAKALGKLSSKGWVDFGPKDADLNLSVQDLDLVYFAPYYGDFLSTKKLLSAQLNLASACKAKDNNLNIVTDFKLSHLAYAQEEPPQEGQLPELNLMKNALDLFSDENGNVNLTFTINTKFDQPTINIKELKGIILEAAAKNLTSQRPDRVIEKIQNTVEQFKDFGKQMENIFKGKD